MHFKVNITWKSWRFQSIRHTVLTQIISIWTSWKVYRSLKCLRLWFAYWLTVAESFLFHLLKFFLPTFSSLPICKWMIFICFGSGVLFKFVSSYTVPFFPFVVQVICRLDIACRTTDKEWSGHATKPVILNFRFIRCWWPFRKTTIPSGPSGCLSVYQSYTAETTTLSLTNFASLPLYSNESN